IYGRTPPRQRQRDVARRQAEIVCRIGQQQHGRGCIEYAGMAANHGLVRCSRRVSETRTRHPLFERIRSRCRIEVSAIEQRGGLNLVDDGGIVRPGLRVLLPFPAESIIQGEAIRDTPRVLRVKSDLVHMEISQPIADLQLVLHERIIETVWCRTTQRQNFQNRVYCGSDISRKNTELIEPKRLKSGQVIVVTANLEDVRSTDERNSIIDLRPPVVLRCGKKIPRAKLSNAVCDVRQGRVGCAWPDFLADGKTQIVDQRGAEDLGPLRNSGMCTVLFNAVVVERAGRQRLRRTAYRRRILSRGIAEIVAKG